MIYLIFYDISSDQIRTKVAKRLIAAGYERLQLSVYAGPMNPRQDKLLWRQLQQWVLTEKTAKFYVLRVGAEQFKNIVAIGKIPFDILYLLGEKSCIFI